MGLCNESAWTKKILCLLSLFILVCSLGGMAFAGKRSIVVKLKASESPDAPVVQTVKLYGASYALVIGIDDYSKGWPRLSNAVRDAKLVADELRKKGFEVTFLKNLKSKDLEDAFEKFFVFKGGDKNARLFAWFAGHGHTMDGEGYIVPADAPRPSRKREFKYKALSLRRFGELARQAESKHALAVFDSCFSGTVFSTGRAMPPPAVTMATTYPVREFISSGDADQQVSDDGRFRKLFIRALNGEEPADFNHDGYLTGTELGMFLADRVANLTQNSQTPRYGKLRDENYDRGDFVFLAGGSVVVEEPTQMQEGSIRIKSTPTGVRVWVNGKYKGTTPLTLSSLTKGSYRIKVKKDGYSEEEKNIEVTSNRAVSAMFFLNPVKQTGRLYVETDPSDAKVRILNIGPKYHDGMELSPGRYHVEVSMEGYETERRWIEVSAGEDAQVSITLSPISTTQGSSHQPGKTWREPSTGMEFVWVPGGCFQMGSNTGYPEEKPVHEVCVDGFWIGKYEVTQGQWKRIMENNPSYFKKGDNYPLEEVSWNDAQDFIRGLSSKSGKSFRLPTEAEWEYAARSGGKDEIYAGGNDVDRVAWYNGNSGRSTHRVGTKAPNGLGIYDMSGNMWEWCEDWYGDDYYRRSPRENPTGPSSGSYRVNRGGSWSDYPRFVRAAGRVRYNPGHRNYYTGFRLALPPGQ